MNKLRDIDFIKIESAIWIANKKTKVPVYDFKFDPLFQINRTRIEDKVVAVGRIGAIMDYPDTYKILSDYGFNLINTPKQHLLASELEQWYPLIENLTPKSKVYDHFPNIKELNASFDFPIFIKGNRQTSKHNPALSIAKTEDEFQKIKEEYAENAILYWQKVVIREFVDLKPMEFTAKDKVQISYEFRTFWWKNELVGAGHYWSQYLDYNWTMDEKKEAIELARSAVPVSYTHLTLPTTPYV